MDRKRSALGSRDARADIPARPVNRGDIKSALVEVRGVGEKSESVRTVDRKLGIHVRSKDRRIGEVDCERVGRGIEVRAAAGRAAQILHLESKAIRRVAARVYR